MFVHAAERLHFLKSHSSLTHIAKTAHFACIYYICTYLRACVVPASHKSWWFSEKNDFYFLYSAELFPYYSADASLHTWYDVWVSYKQAPKKKCTLIFYFKLYVFGKETQILLGNVKMFLCLLFMMCVAKTIMKAMHI